MILDIPGIDVDADPHEHPNVDNELDMDSKSEDNTSCLPALYVAVAVDDEYMTRRLLEKGARADDCCAHPYEYVSALHLAAENGNIRMMNLLLPHVHGDVDICDDEARITPLFHACQWDRVDAVRYLIAKGANLFAEGKYGESPPLAALSNGSTRVLAFLMNNVPRVRRLYPKVVRRRRAGERKGRVDHTPGATNPEEVSTNNVARPT